MKKWDIVFLLHANPMRRLTVENIGADSQQAAVEFAREYLALPSAWILDHVAEVVVV